MYEQFFNLKEKPFNMTPDPEYLFLTDKHREALAHLVYGIEQRRGFIVITGEVGTGKTTICRSLLTQFGEDTRIALILNPMLSEVELLESILNEFYIPVTEKTKKGLLEQLDSFLIQQHSQGRNVVLVIDEAQNLPFETLEQIRIISNLETEKVKLIQIVLLGQPELSEKLSSPQLRQLEQRVSVRFHLTPLTQEETRDYIQHRITVAGGTGTIHFDEKALKTISDHTQGVPRKVNILCDRALLVAFVEGTGRITENIIKQAWGEIQNDRRSKKTLTRAVSGEPDLSVLGKAAPLNGAKGVLTRAVVALIVLLLVSLVAVNVWLVMTVRGLGGSTLVSQPESSVRQTEVQPTGSLTEDDETELMRSPLDPPLIGGVDTESLMLSEASSSDPPLVTGVSTESPMLSEAFFSAPPLVTEVSAEAPSVGAMNTESPELSEASSSEPPLVTGIGGIISSASSIPSLGVTLDGSFDSDGVFRTAMPDAAPWAARATLCRIWDASEDDLRGAFEQANASGSATAFFSVMDGFCEVSFVLDATRVRGIGLPCVLWADDGEPAVLMSILDDEATLAWAPLGKFSTNWNELLKEWSGRVTYLLPVSWRLEEHWHRGVEASKAIFRMQNALREMGYFPYTPNGNYGVKTEEAVKRFQAERGLTADGIVGQETFIAFKAATESDAPRLFLSDDDGTGDQL